MCPLNMVLDSYNLNTIKNEYQYYITNNSAILNSITIDVTGFLKNHFSFKIALNQIHD